MKVVIAGSRSITQYFYVDLAMEIAKQKYGIIANTIISGACPKGVDVLGEEYAKKHSLDIEKYPADWNKYKKRAVRNAEMANIADVGVIVWDRISKGTSHIFDCLFKLNKPILLYCLQSQNIISDGQSNSNKSVVFYKTHSITYRVGISHKVTHLTDLLIVMDNAFLNNTREKMDNVGWSQ